MQPLRLLPKYREYIWGGKRLRPTHPIQTAEAWVVYEKNKILEGPYQGQTLSQASDALKVDLLGRRVMERTGLRFPLLIKLLDCAEWLSLQVHPDDQQAQRLEGVEFFGKTEAWHILDAKEGAQLIGGVREGIEAEELKQAIRDGSVIDLVQFIHVVKGDTILMLPGTLHAIGPGLMLYEVQQTSDITYRVYDWKRPQTPERRLHIEESLVVADPRRVSKATALPEVKDGTHSMLCQSDYFQLHYLISRHRPAQLDTGGESFHALTGIQGQGVVVLNGQVYPLNLYESLIIPACCGAYEVTAKNDDFRVLLAHG